MFPFLVPINILRVFDQPLPILSDLSQLLFDDIIDFVHESVSWCLWPLSITQGHLVEIHNLQRKIGYGFQEILAKSISELSFGCFFHFNDLISLLNFLFQNINDSLILDLDMLDILVCLFRNSSCISVFVCQSE